MKTFTKYFKNLIPILFIGFLFVSCGTHNNNDYDESDGIYSNDGTSVVTEDTSTSENDKNNYYKQYFKTKELTYDEVPEDDAIFTDIEAYHTTESLDEEGYVVVEEESEYDEGYGAWGTNSTEVSINYYGGFGYSPYWGGGYWGMSFGWGWGYPYYGYGYGYPYYGWCYPYYGYGYGYGYPYYGYPYYGYGYGNGYAYNRGRRNTDYYASRSNSRGNSSNRYSQGRTASSRRSSSYTSRRGTYTRGETSRRTSYNSNNVRRSSNTTQRNNSINRRSSSSRSNTYTRPSSSSSRSNSYRSPSRSSSRSSGGSYRSSGGSSRGGSSSGGGRRGGR